MFCRTLVFFAAAVALAACGNPASEPVSTSALPMVSEAPSGHPATPPKAAAAPSTAIPAAAAAATPVAMPPPESAQCLELVAKAAFVEAVPICVKAVSLDPDNAALKQALETARTKTATAALGSSPAIPGTGNDPATGARGAKLP